MGSSDRTGAREAVRHLLELGHRTIAYIGGPPKDIVEIERFDGYCQALAAAGMERDEALIHFPGVKSADGYRAMAQVLQLPTRPTAAFVASDMAAMGRCRRSPSTTSGRRTTWRWWVSTTRSARSPARR